MSQALQEIDFQARRIEDPRFAPGQLPGIGRLGRIPSSWSLLPETQPSAVLCLLIPSHNDSHASVLLTRRSTLVRTHKGQIGFPGGRAEPPDTGPVETALRESMEEISLDPNQVLIHGSLPWIRALDRKLVIPILGSTDLCTSSFQANDEVEEIIPVPWPVFCHKQSQKFGFTLFGTRRESILYQYRNYRIWGLTAKMLNDAQFFI